MRRRYAIRICCPDDCSVGAVPTRRLPGRDRIIHLWFHCLATRAKRRERVDLTGLTPTTARPYRHLYAPVCTPLSRCQIEGGRRSVVSRTEAASDLGACL